MTMQMTTAFNFNMQTPLPLFKIGKGGYNAENIWEEGAVTLTDIRGVFNTGNKFSQFGEGESLQSMDGGFRNSNYRELYVLGSYTVDFGDKILWKGNYYNVLQKSDESIFGFFAYLIEKDKDWNPEGDVGATNLTAVWLGVPQ